MGSTKKIGFIFIVIIAIITRIWGITFSLPHTYHVDEARFAKISIGYFSGDLNPHFFHVPSLHSYLVSGIWGVYFIIGKIFGAFHSSTEFIESFNNNVTVFFILGRLLTALLSIATILIIFLLGKKMYNPRVGFLAALILIFSPIHNKISHYMVPDVPMVCFFLLAFLFIWFIYQKGNTKFYILAGLFAGLASATKYGGQLLFLPLFLAHLFHLLDGKEPIKNIFLSYNLILSGAFFLAGFFIGCPYAILDFATFWRDFKWQSQHLYTTGHLGSSMAQPAWLFYLWHGFKENIGKYSQYLVLGGVVYGLFKHKKREILLLSLPLVLFVIIGSWKTKAVRYLLPLAPFFILIGSFFLDFLLNKISSYLSKSPNKFISLINRGFLSWIIIISFLFSPALKVVRFNYILTKKDTRTVAKEWIKTNLPKGSRIALEMYTPPLSRSDYRITYKHSLSRVSLEWLANRKIEYIVVSDIMYARFTRYPHEFPREASFYNFLNEKAVLIKSFEPKWNDYLIDLHNPTIKIYKLSDYPNFSFPGNFIQYSQVVNLIKNGVEQWKIQSTIKGYGLIEGSEKIKNPYVRIVDSDEKEIFKLTVYDGEIKSDDKFSYSNSGESFPLPQEAKIYIGYEYYFYPSLWNIPLEAMPKKEHLLVKKIEKSSLIKKNKLNYIFLYTSFPNTRGDDYFQIIEISKPGAIWSLSTIIFGGELSWGNDYVVDPFVKITDSKDNEVKNLIIFKGRLGSLEAKRKGPIRKSLDLIQLPEYFKVFAGYFYYFDQEYPERAGGPESIELTIPSLHED